MSFLAPTVAVHAPSRAPGGRCRGRMDGGHEVAAGSFVCAVRPYVPASSGPGVCR
jgi:hypothetical protein